MRKSLTILFLFIACFSSCKQKEGDVIAGIKKNVVEINKNLKKYTQKHTDDLTTTEGGSITGYYRDEELKKIYAENFGESSRMFSEYYFDDGMLILVVKQEFLYNRPVTYTQQNARENNDTEWYDDKKTKLSIYKYYFSKNKLIKWTEGDNKELSVSAANFTDRESELWAETVVLIKELKEQE